MICQRTKFHKCSWALPHRKLQKNFVNSFHNNIKLTKTKLTFSALLNTSESWGNWVLNVSC